MSELLLFMLIADLRDYSDNDLHEVLELLLGFPLPEPDARVDELREAILDQLQAGQLDRDVIATWPEEFEDLLPAQMSGYLESKEDFWQLWEETPEDAEDQENDRLAALRFCLDLLDEGSDWKHRAQAARRLGALEEELFVLRDAYTSRPISLEECSPASVVAHRQLLEGFEIWQRALRSTHSGQLDEAFDHGLQASRLLRAVASWSHQGRLKTARSL